MESLLQIHYLFNKHAACYYGALLDFETHFLILFSPQSHVLRMVPPLQLIKLRLREFKNQYWFIQLEAMEQVLGFKSTEIHYFDHCIPKSHANYSIYQIFLICQENDKPGFWNH